MAGAAASRFLHLSSRVIAAEIDVTVRCSEEVGMFRSRQNQIMYHVAIIAATALTCAAAFAQSPPSTDAPDARARCMAMGDEKAEKTVSHVLSIADGASVGMSAAAVDILNKDPAEMLGSSHSSKYNAATNRC